MPYLIRIAPGDLGPKWDGMIAHFTADQRIVPGRFIMLVKGNATRGLNDAEKSAQAEA